MTPTERTRWLLTSDEVVRTAKYRKGNPKVSMQPISIDGLSEEECEAIWKALQAESTMSLADVLSDDLELVSFDSDSGLSFDEFRRQVLQSHVKA